MSLIRSRATVFSTPWFDVTAKETDLDPKPYYSLALPDYLSVVAITRDGDILFVRQYRPALERYMLELPAGTLDPGESPEPAAARELLEETGHVADRFELLGTLHPDTGRLQNRMWCYLATDAGAASGWTAEHGLEVVRMKPQAVMDAIRKGELTHALDIATVMLFRLRTSEVAQP